MEEFMEYKLLDKISEPNDVKKIRPEYRDRLAKEIRHFLINKVSKTGGHLASNLGVVELTIALHLVLDFPEDKLVWDVGHQAYTHKILTGRKEGFDSLRQFGGMSGFPKIKESDCDAFDVGHSSTSISAAIGLCEARDRKGDNNKVFAVIGDGALSGGMAYEALNNAARMKSNLVIVLNDNDMSITENVGGMANYLGKIRTGTNYKHLKENVETALRNIPEVGDRVADHIKHSKDVVKRLFVSGMLFEDMGLTYIGPIDGHNIEAMRKAFVSAQRAEEAVIIHVVTQKGKGYMPAVKNPSAFHGVEPFDVRSGEVKNKSKKETTYTQVFGKTIVNLAAQDDRVVAISAAMPSGTGLMEYRELFPKRYFDVGIAEEHAVTFAAGLAAGGIRPVVALYSTFLQRAYDQILHDVCLENLPVTFAIDRSGLVGSDGETHQGVFDTSFLTNIPNLTIMSPASGEELEEMLKFAVDLGSPAVVRYPRGAAGRRQEFAIHKGSANDLAEKENVDHGADRISENNEIVLGKAQLVYKGSEVVILGVGTMAETALSVKELLQTEGINATVVNVRFVKPFDKELIKELAKEHKTMVIIEENVQTGGFGQMVGSFLLEEGLGKIRFIPISLPDSFIEHGSVECLREKYGLDAKSIADKIL